MEGVVLTSACWPKKWKMNNEKYKEIRYHAVMSTMGETEGTIQLYLG